MSFEQIRISDRVAAELLSFVSRIEPKAIPQSLLPRKGRSAEEMENAVGTLCAYAFLTRREENDMFDMHSLVHVATRVWIQRCGDSQNAAMTALAHFNEVLMPGHPEYGESWRIYLPHAIRLLQEMKEYQAEDKYYLLDHVGNCLGVDGRFKDAIKCFEEICTWKRENFAEEDESRLTA